MSKSNRNGGKPWSSNDVHNLKILVKENTPTRVIGLKLGRTENAIYSKASEENISLKPTNQSPYNRRTCCIILIFTKVIFIQLTAVMQ